MNKLDLKLKDLKKNKKLGFMTHVVVGYPSLEHTVALVKLMAEEGVDIVELQIPFSDPLADGPVIMLASEIALGKGIKVKDAFKVMRDLSNNVSIPLLFMGYYNNVFNYGVPDFCKDAKGAGASGLIVPDMPIEAEKDEHYLRSCKRNKLHNIQFLSPASTDIRLAKNAKVASGFVYFSARQGTTGVRSELDPNLKKNLQHLRHFFSCPLAVGFGISKKEHVNVIRPHADIVVIGSALIQLINESKSDEEMMQKTRHFLQNIMS